MESLATDRLMVIKMVYTPAGLPVRPPVPHSTIWSTEHAVIWAGVYLREAELEAARQQDATNSMARTLVDLIYRDPKLMAAVLGR